MSKQKLSKLAKSVQNSLKKHSPEILTGIGIAGMITATVMAVQSTPKALILIEEKKEEFDVEKLQPIDIVKTTWKCYIPTVAISGISIVCLICACSANARHHAALATAYAISESSLKEYQEKVIETIGEKKEQSIRDSIAKDKIEQNPIQTSGVIITGKGDTLCYDSLFGRYFKSDIDKIKKAENELNRKMLDEMYVSLNDFYYELGLNGVKAGDELGWNVNRDRFVDLIFSSQLTEDDVPCLVVGHRNPPGYDYQS